MINRISNSACILLDYYIRAWGQHPQLHLSQKTTQFTSLAKQKNKLSLENIATLEEKLRLINDFWTISKHGTQVGNKYPLEFLYKNQLHQFTDFDLENVNNAYTEIAKIILQLEL